MEQNTVQGAVKSVYEATDISQKKLADKIGAKSQQAVYNMMNAKNGMRADNLVKLMNAMGYDVLIRDRVTDKEVKLVTE